MRLVGIIVILFLIRIFETGSSSTIDPPGPAKVFFKAKEVRASSFVYINKGIMRD